MICENGHIVRAGAFRVRTLDETYNKPLLMSLELFSVIKHSGC